MKKKLSEYVCNVCKVKVSDEANARRTCVCGRVMIERIKGIVNK